MRPIWLYVLLLLLIAAAVAAAVSAEVWRPAEIPTSTPAPWPTRKPTRTPTPTAIPTATATTAPAPTATPTPTPRLTLSKITALGRIETVEYAMQVVVDMKQDPTGLWQRLFGADRLLLVAGGEVVAGFDMTTIRESDIQIDGDAVILTLPAPEVLHTRVDNKETFVQQRNTGLLVPFDIDLESEARARAEQEMLAWAMAHDLLAKAEENGKLWFENFLTRLGFAAVEVRVRSHRN